MFKFIIHSFIHFKTLIETFVPGVLSEGDLAVHKAGNIHSLLEHTVFGVRSRVQGDKQ